MTAVVLGIVVFEKFEAGAYLVVILVPVLVGMMLFISRQYARSAPRARGRSGAGRRAAAPRGAGRRPDLRASTGRPSRPSTSAARSTTTSAPSTSRPTPTARPPSARRFERQVPGVPLVVVESPYRALAGPLLAYLDVLDAAWPPDKPEPITFVVIPEYVARSWWERHPLQPVGQAAAPGACSGGATRSS